MGRGTNVDFSKALASAGCVLTKSRVVVISSLDKHDLINLEGTFQENCNGRCIRYPTFFLSLNSASPQIEQNSTLLLTVGFALCI